MREKNIIAEINYWLQGDDKAFEMVYRYYYSRLHSFIFKYIRDKMETEDMVAEVLLRVWQKRNSIKANTFENYLFTIARNLLITAWRKKIDFLFSLDAVDENLSNSDSDSLIYKELTEVYQQSLNDLPEQRRRIFLMHREESLTYNEIADKLHISPKTVENQMSASLKHLRSSLSQYLASVIF